MTKTISDLWYPTGNAGRGLRAGAGYESDGEHFVMYYYIYITLSE